MRLFNFGTDASEFEQDSRLLCAKTPVSVDRPSGTDDRGKIVVWAFLVKLTLTTAKSPIQSQRGVEGTAM